MYYLLFYKTVPGYLQKREAFRDEHLRLAREAQKRGILLMAGALADPADEALFVFRCNDPAEAEDFARNDPYVINGLISSWLVRPWTVVIDYSGH